MRPLCCFHANSFVIILNAICFRIKSEKYIYAVIQFYPWYNYEGGKRDLDRVSQKIERAISCFKQNKIALSHKIEGVKLPAGVE